MIQSEGRPCPWPWHSGCMLKLVTRSAKYLDRSCATRTYVHPAWRTPMDFGRPRQAAMLRLMQRTRAPSSGQGWQFTGLLAAPSHVRGSMHVGINSLPSSGKRVSAQRSDKRLGRQLACMLHHSSTPSMPAPAHIDRLRTPGSKFKLTSDCWTIDDPPKTLLMPLIVPGKCIDSQ